MLCPKTTRNGHRRVDATVGKRHADGLLTNSKRQSAATFRLGNSFSLLPPPSHHLGPFKSGFDQGVSQAYRWTFAGLDDSALSGYSGFQSHQSVMFFSFCEQITL